MNMITSLPEFNDPYRYEFDQWVPFHDEHSNVIGFTFVTFEKDYDNSVTVSSFDTSVDISEIEYFIYQSYTND